MRKCNDCDSPGGLTPIESPGFHPDVESKITTRAFPPNFGNRNGEMSDMSTDRWLEINQIAAEHGLSREDAIALIDKAPGIWKNKVYHSCCECPVGVIDGDKVPFSWNEDLEVNSWTCCACEEEVFSMDELALEPFKLMPEGFNRTAIFHVNREKTEQEKASDLF